MKIFGKVLRARRGQGMTEYVGISTILLLGALGLIAGWPFTRALFDALQMYIDLYFYSLNLGIG
jgi:hypothetical protein